MQWFNEPPEWNVDEQQNLTVKTGAKTDFWRTTHYGFIRDNGHFYYQEVDGDFEVTVKVTGNYQNLYDQAGLMLREDEQTWLKCGIEFVEGQQNASVVITRQFSDWSVVSLQSNPTSIWLKLKRNAEAVEVSYSTDGEHYQMIRLGYLSTQPRLQVGMMCATPEAEGLQVKFEDFKIAGPLS